MRLQRSLRIAAAAGVAALAFGAVSQPEKFWPTLLLAGFYALSLSLGAAVFLAIQRVSGARWSADLEKPARAIIGCYWPAAAVVLVALVFGRTEFYGWTLGGHGHTEVAQAQKAWLSPGFFLIRAVLYLLIWGALVRGIRSVASAAAFLVAFGITISFAAVDWLMALEPGWSSTMFGVYVFAGILVGSVASLCVVTCALHGTGALAPSSPSQLHNLGKLLFGFSMFWAYIWYCQYMLIWYANIPEETGWLARRQENGWGWVGLVLVFGHFVLPFLALISRGPKRRPRLLALAAVWLLVMHWVDIFWLVMPAGSPGSPLPHLVDLTLLVGLGSLFLAGAAFAVRGRSLVPERDPRLEESLAFENA